MSAPMPRSLDTPDPPIQTQGAKLSRATQADVPAIRSIVLDAYAKYVERIGKPPAPMTADYKELLDTHNVFVLRRSEDDSIVGSIVLGYETGSMSVKINNLVVHVAAQGSGFGKALMRYAEEFARSKGCTALELFTNVMMYENLVLYPKMGFVETERKIEDGYERAYFRKDLI